MDELSRKDVEQLREALLEQKTRLLQLMESTRSGAKPVDLDEPIGRLTRMDAMQQQATLQAERRAYDLKRRQTEQALERMDLGTYGLCLKCDEPISLARLKARPESPFCLDCQSNIDKKHAK